LLFASRLSANSCCVAPSIKLDEAGFTVTDAMGIGKTLIVAPPLLPSLVAAMVAVPTLTPVTSPLAETVAMLVSSELQLTERPITTPPATSNVVAVACALSDVAIVVGARTTVTEASFPEQKSLALIPVEAGAYYVMDRAYVDFPRLARWQEAGAYFVVRSLDNISFLDWNRMNI